MAIKTPVGDAPVIPVVGLLIGGYLAWFGIHYWRQDVKWPSDPVKGVLTGKGPPAAPSAPQSHQAELLAEVSTASASEGPAAPPGSPGTTGTPPSVTGNYSHADLEALWTAVGGDPKQANNAACHGIQESSGSPTVTSPNPDGGTNVGLWQLDTKGKGAGFSLDQLKNPVTNAQITVMATNNGTDWSAWSTPGC